MSAQFAGQRVTVQGLGTFGGGVGAVRFLASRGAQVLVTDLRDESLLSESLNQLADVPEVTYRLGRHDVDDFRKADVVVVNPSVAPDNEFVAAARDAGVPLTTEMCLFWQQQQGRVIAITGSNGKSTTTALTHALIAASGQTCWLGGNIGKSLLPVVDQIGPEDCVVLELSSFQLEWLNGIRARPEIALVTNFSPNHLDWHGTLENYRLAKQSILRWQRSSDWAILNADDPDVASWPGAAQRCWFGTTATGHNSSRLHDSQLCVVCDCGTGMIDLSDGFMLPGEHNQMNAAAAVAAAVIAGASTEQIRSGLRVFQALPHRLQLVAQGCGRSFYDDSIATTPESAIAGLRSFHCPIVLFAGGYDKHVDLTAFSREIATRTKAVALMGQTASLLRRGIEESTCDSRPAVYCPSSLAEAFDWAVSQSSPGDAIILSPGCASYDWFRNYVDRGEQFGRLANAWCEAHR